MTGDQRNGRSSASVDAPPPTNTNGTAPHANGTKAGDVHTQQQQQQQQQLPLPLPPSSSSPQYDFADVCHKLRHKVLAFLDEDVPVSNELLRNVQSQVRESVDVIEQALRRYSLDQISLSYNGGKDCLVLLILILACLPICNDLTTSAEHCDAFSQPTSQPTTTTPTTIAAAATPETAATAAATAAAVATTTQRTESELEPKLNSTSTTSRPPHHFQAIYIVPPDPFPEVDEFVDASTADYHLDLARYPLPMRAALDAYLADRPAVRAIFMGTRRTDPHGEFLTHFTPTDAGWPQFMRIHPVIDWHYAEIWGFIRHLDIPFCNLYNRGFTSLGGTTDTRPNPVLAKRTKSGSGPSGGGAGADGADNDNDDEDNGGASTPTSFRPAYELLDDDEERLGRGK